MKTKNLLCAALLGLSAAATSLAGESITVKDFTLTTGSLKDAACRSAASMRLGYGALNPIETGEFYITSRKGKSLVPTSDREHWWDIQKGPDAITFTTKKENNSAYASATYTLRHNSLSMTLDIDVPPATSCNGFVWDIFLSKDLFSGASFTADGVDKGTLNLADFPIPDEGWTTILQPVKTLIAETKVGTWQFDLGADAKTSWQLRCDQREWRPENLRTFTLLYYHREEMPQGGKAHLTVDMKFTPVSPTALEDFKTEMRNSTLVSILKDYGYVPPSAELPARPAERADWLAKKVCSVPALLNENGLTPSAAMVIPEPKSYMKGKGSFPLPATLEIAAAPAHEAAVEALSAELARYNVKVTQVAPEKNASVMMGVASAPAIAKLCAEIGVDCKQLKPEGYALAVTPQRVLIAGVDERGVLFGAQTMRQLICGSNGKAEIAEGMIMDWPDLKTRGFYVEGAASASPEEMRHLIRDVYSYWKAKTLLVEVRWQYWQWKTHPEVNETKRFKRDTMRPLSEMSDLAQYARKYKMDLIPCVFTYGKVEPLLEAHPEIAEEPDNERRSVYCPNNPETYKLIFDLMGELIDATGCTTMHIGHDEIAGMAKCPICSKIPPGDLFANDVNKIARWLAEKKIRTMIWGDMLLDFNCWDKLKVTSAHSNFKTFGSLPVHLGLDKIDKDVIICDWHYRPIDKELPTHKYFIDAGHQVIAVPWFDPYNNYYSAVRIKEHGGDGLIVSNWGFLASRSPQAASMLGLAYAWNSGLPEPNRLPFDYDRVWAASILRRDRPSRFLGATFAPVDLTPAANRTLGGSAPDAWFGMGTNSDLASLPPGPLKLFGTDYRIGPKVVVVGRTPKGAERVFPDNSAPIPINAKARSLIFLHGMAIDTPSVNPREFGFYNVKYADGKSVKASINGGNIGHWLLDTVHQNGWGFPMVYRMDSLLAWRGCTLTGKEIGLQASEWVNPRSDEAIASVELCLSVYADGLKVGLVALTAVQCRD